MCNYNFNSLPEAKLLATSSYSWSCSAQTVYCKASALSVKPLPSVAHSCSQLLLTSSLSAPALLPELCPVTNSSPLLLRKKRSYNLRSCSFERTKRELIDNKILLAYLTEPVTSVSLTFSQRDHHKALQLAWTNYSTSFSGTKKKQRLLLSSL